MKLNLMKVFGTVPLKVSGPLENGSPLTRWLMDIAIFNKVHLTWVN